MMIHCEAGSFKIVARALMWNNVFKEKCWKKRLTYHQPVGEVCRAVIS